MIRRRDFSALWDAPHRPLFLLAFLCALLTVAWWPLGAQLGLPEPALEPAVLWHVHELLFGFASAAIAGYLLTALPGWTGRPPLRGAGLLALVAVWLLARIAIAAFSAMPLAVPLLLNGAFSLGLAGYLLSELIAARTFRKLGFAAAVLALGLGEAAFLARAGTGNVYGSLEVAKTVISGLALLLFSVGARAVPAFTRNWLAQTGNPDLQFRDRPRTRGTAQVLLVLALALQLAGASHAAEAVLTAAAVPMIWMMSGWQTAAALSNPLLAALHLGFLWLPLGAFAVGFSELNLADYPPAAAVHAITIGAMTGLIMAIAGRAAAHSDDGKMRAGAGFSAGAGLIWTAVWLRLAAPAVPAFSEILVSSSALLWTAAWIAFITGFLPALTGPVRRPVLSGQRFDPPVARPGKPPDWNETARDRPRSYRTTCTGHLRRNCPMRRRFQPAP
ncbi:NnrS family protein [Leisingera sp. ANG59]|uniref:NnrS family protein n=1 Tax=Leisingera sp. ANG59 TaxID=2675221 RepID=UPI001572E019